MWSLRDSVGLNGNLYSIDSPDRLFGNDLFGRAHLRHAAAFQKYQPTAILGGQVQIVKDGDNGQQGKKRITPS